MTMTSASKLCGKAHVQVKHEVHQPQPERGANFRGRCKTRRPVILQKRRILSPRADCVVASRPGGESLAGALHDSTQSSSLPAGSCPEAEPPRDIEEAVAGVSSGKPDSPSVP
mmetsp:Transcript_70643/g.117006  ORF Transcript_70643/g.117006 Transcript_70643/m.117006 type:complete len:113 (-) Transcript_70643:591-929(-)